jgi:hypothetical protein
MSVFRMVLIVSGDCFPKSTRGDVMGSTELSHLEEPLVAQLLKNFPTFFVAQRFIIVLNSLPLVLMLSQMKPVHITPSYFSALSYHLRLHIPSGFSTKILCIPFPMRITYHAHLLPLDLICVIISEEGYKL